MSVFQYYKNLSRKKKIVTFILGIVLVITVISIISAARAKQKYETTKVTRQNIVEVVKETGIVQTTGMIPIYSPSNGIVTGVFVTNGQVVQTGDVLATVQSTATEKEKSDALAAYLLAKSQYESAQTKLYTLQASLFSTWEDFKNLAENDTYETSDGKPREENRTLPEFLVSQKEWLAAEKTFKDQQTNVSQSQAALASAQRSYEATQNAKLKATGNGAVANISITVGSSVTASTTKPLAIVVTDAANEIVISLGESDIPKVAVGQKSSIEVKAVPGLTLQGHVSRLDSIGSEVKGVIRYAVYLTPDTIDTRLRSGMKTDVTITTQEKQNVVAVPNSAVKPYKGSKAVRIVGAKNVVAYVPVTVGIKGNAFTEITSGLTEGQSIIQSLPNDQIKRTGPFGF